MMKKEFLYIVCAIVLIACNKPSRLEQYRAEKHVKDSTALVEQQRTLAYYEGQLEALMPIADSLLTFFTYERNEKYQDHGYYVAKRSNVRILVRDDGREILVYKEGKRQANPDNSLRGKDKEAIEQAKELQIVIKDIQECEKRIKHTSLEVQKYEKRLEKQ